MNLKSLLFHNTSPKQTVAKNSFRLLLSEFVARIFTFLISLRVARSLGVIEFWSYNFVMTFCTFFVLIVDFGLGNLTFRELSKDWSQLQKYFSNTIVLKLIISVIVIAVVAVVAKLSPDSHVYFGLIMVFLLHSILTNIWEFVRVFFRPVERMQNEAYLKIINWVILLLCTLFFVLSKPTIQSIFYGFLTASVINLVISWVYVTRHFQIQSRSVGVDRKFIGKIARMAIPFFLGGVFVYFYSDVNVVLLKFFKGTQEVWLFSAPYRLLAYVYILFNVFSLAIFKNLVNAAKDALRFKRVMRTFAKYNILISITFFILIFFLGKRVILLLYGPAFVETDILLKILSAIVIFKSLSYVYGAGLTALSKEYTRLYIQIGIAVINIAANLILIPKFGPLGAAYSLAIAEVCLMLSYRWSVYRYIRKIQWTTNSK